MSIRLMSEVFSLTIPSTPKFVLLAMADFASDDGTKVYPSVATIARKCSLTTRAVQYAIKDLIAWGYLIEVHKASQHYTKEYKITLPQSGTSFTPEKTRDERHSPLTTPGVNVVQGGVNVVQGGGEPHSPNPSLTIIEPSNLPQHVEACEPAFAYDLTVLFDDKPQTEERKNRTDDEHKKATLQALSSGINRNGSAQRLIEKAFLILPNWRTKQGGDFLLWFKSTGGDLEANVETFKRWWYAHDWRGKQGQPPTLRQIQELWPQAFASPVQRETFIT